MPKVGGKLGRFKLERKLGKGGMGVVYLAHDPLLNIKVALKLLNPSLAKAGAFARFSREVLVARRVSHPGICRLFDIHEAGDILFITMEYVEGPTLESLIMESGILPTGQAGDIIAAICRAFSSAHRRGIVHRDLKPSNIIIRPGNRVSILDFGLAKALDMASITAAGTLVGTIHYMSPEVILGKPATPQSDIYSTGVILYRCVTGRLPFQGNDVVDIKKAIESGKSVPPSQFNPDVRRKLERVITQAMAVEPGERFETVDDFKEALTDALVGVSDVHELPEYPTGPWHGDIDKSIQEALVDPSYSEILRTHTRETTILFSDIVGITPYFDKHGDVAGCKRIKTHNDLLFPVIERCRGKVIKTMGDAIMACFDDADDAVEAGIEMQITLDTYNACSADDEEKIFIRIGLHTGKSIFEDRDIFGNAVNVAARIGSKAESSEILVSSATREMLTRTRHVALYHSATSLKGKQDIYNLYSISWDPLADVATIEKSLADLGSPSDTGIDTGDTDVGKPVPRRPELGSEADVEMDTDVDALDRVVTARSEAPAELKAEDSQMVADRIPTPAGEAPWHMVQMGFDEEYDEEFAAVATHLDESKSAGQKTSKNVRNVVIVLLACTAVAVVAGMGISLIQRSSKKSELTEVGMPAFDLTSTSLKSGSIPEEGRTTAPSPLVELSQLERKLHDAMRKKKISAGRFPIFDKEYRRMTDLREKSRYSEALEAGERALAILEQIRVKKTGKPPPPQDRKTASAPVSASPLVSLSNMERSINATVRNKGIIPGDSPEFDAAYEKMKVLWRTSKYTNALAVGRQAQSILEKIRINKSFVNDKLNRFNDLFDTVENDAIAEKIGALAKDILTAIDSGKYGKANWLINRAFGIVGTK